MRILFVIAGLARGGQERQLAELAVGLVRRGHTVDVAVAFQGDYYEPFLVERGVNVIPLRPFQRKRYQLQLHVRAREMALRLTALWSTVRKGRYDVVHGYGDTSNLYASLACGPRPRPAVVWGIRASEHIGNKHSNKIAPWISRRVDLIICNSHAGARLVDATGFRPRRLAVVPNGIDVDRCSIDLAARSQVRRKLGVADDENLVGIIGNLHPRKGVGVFLEAAAKVDLSLRPKFLVLGHDWSNSWPALQEFAEALGIANAIIRHDQVPDVERYMNALDVLVSASFTEGFSNVLAEGLACGVPCVATDVGDSAMIVESVGRVVPPGDPTAMAAAIERMLRGDHPVPEAIREAITSQFTIEKLVDRTEVLLEEARR